MSVHDDKVKRLLDGEIDEAEIAADPVLASLAERIFGLNIEPITPTKPSQASSSPAVEVVPAVTSNEPMIEVIPGAKPALSTPMSLPALPKFPNKNRRKEEWVSSKFSADYHLLLQWPTYSGHLVS